MRPCVPIYGVCYFFAFCEHQNMFVKKKFIQLIMLLSCLALVVFQLRPKVKYLGLWDLGADDLMISSYT